MAYICKSARNVRFLRLFDKPILSDLHGSGCIAAAVIIVIFACVVTAYFLCCALCVVCMLCGSDIFLLFCQLSCGSLYFHMPSVVRFPPSVICDRLLGQVTFTGFRVPVDVKE